MDRAAAVRARLIHLLEPERRRPTARIDEVLVGAVAARLIPEHRPPERHDLGGNGRTRDDQQALDRRRVGGEAKPSGNCRDLAGQLDVARAHPAVVVGARDQTHGHAVVMGQRHLSKLAGRQRLSLCAQDDTLVGVLDEPRTADGGGFERRSLQDNVDTGFRRPVCRLFANIHLRRHSGEHSLPEIHARAIAPPRARSCSRGL